MKTSTKVLSAIGGVLLILAGIWAFVKPLNAFIALEFMTGTILLITGVISLISYFMEKKSNGWLIFDAVISVACGLIFLFSNYKLGIFAITVSVSLGFWLMMMGISQVNKSLKLKKLGAHSWGFMTALGVISIICSLSVFIHPISAAVGTQTFLMGILLMVGGISLLTSCFSKV